MHSVALDCMHVPVPSLSWTQWQTVPWFSTCASRWRRKQWSSAQSSILLDIHSQWVCDHQLHQNLRRNLKNTRQWSWSFSTEVQTLSICWFPWTALSMMNTEMSVSVLRWIQLHCTRSTLLASPALSLGSIQNWMSSRSCTTAMNLLSQQMLAHLSSLWTRHLIKMDRVKGRTSGNWCFLFFCIVKALLNN